MSKYTFHDEQRVWLAYGKKLPCGKTKTISQIARETEIPRTTVRDWIHKLDRKKGKPKILYWDIETSHTVGLFYPPLYNTHINQDDVLFSSVLLCGAWQWEGEEKIHSVSLLDDMEAFNNNRYDIRDMYINDRVVVERLNAVLSEADIVIAHNGDEFDMKKVNHAFIKHGFMPPNKSLFIDTLKEARKIQKTESNSLNYLCRCFGVPVKMETSKGLFRRAFLGDIEAMKELIEYNKYDIPPLRGLYMKLRPFMKSHPNMNLFVGDEHCAACASPNIEYTHETYTRVSERPAYRCGDCGYISIDGRANSSVKVR